MGLRCPAWPCRQRYISNVPQGGPRLQGVLHCLRSGSAATCLVSPVIGGVALLVPLYSWCLFSSVECWPAALPPAMPPLPTPRLCRWPSFPNVCRGGQRCSAGRGVPRPYDAEGHRWRAGLGREDQVNLGLFVPAVEVRSVHCCGWGWAYLLFAQPRPSWSQPRQAPACLPACLQPEGEQGQQQPLHHLCHPLQQRQTAEGGAPGLWLAFSLAGQGRAGLLWVHMPQQTRLCEKVTG